MVTDDQVESLVSGIAELQAQVLRKAIRAMLEAFHDNRRAAPPPASQPDTVAVPIQTLHVSLQVLTFLKAVLIGQGYQKDSSSIHQLEIAYSMLKAAQEAK